MIGSLLLIAILAFVTVPRPAAVAKPRRKKRIRPSRRRDIDVGMLLTQVSTRLQSGATTQDAWRASLNAQGIGAAPASFKETDDDGVPAELRQLWFASAWQLRRRGISETSRSTLPAVFAVARIGKQSGAPLAEVLDACARGITESGEAMSAREIALAGPQASARMLAFLPVIGIIFGSLFGTDPFGFFTGDLFGRIVFVTGAVLEITGVLWMLQLIARAKREEPDQ